jgi:hypothetical protein
MLFASMLLATSFVHAQTNILLGNGLANSIQFTGTGSGANVAFLGTCGANACTTGTAGIGFSMPGSFEMDYNAATPLIISNTLGSNGYLMSGAVNFSFALTDGTGSLTGTITFSAFSDGSTTPSFRGSFTTTSVTGSLTSLFGPGTLDGVVFTVQTNGSAVDTIFGNNGQVLARPYSGNVPAPAAPPPVPEPASIALLGSGLLALGGTLKRRFFNK